MPGDSIDSVGNRDSAWVEHAIAALGDAGYQRGGARLAVIELLARQDCAMTAIEIDDRLRAAGQAIGRASVYRTLEQLEELKLVHRLEIGRGMASYERAEPSGEHHHHVVCNQCGRVAQFADDGLEQAIATLSQRLDFAIDQHDVVLRGSCPNCR